MIASIKKYGLFIVIGMFCVLYHPAILPFNSMHVVGLASWMYLVIIDGRLGTIKLEKSIINVILNYVILAAYIVIFCMILNRGSITNLADSFFFIVDIIPFACVIKKYGEKNNCTSDDFINLLLVVGLVQASTSILAFVNRSMQQQFLNMMISYGYQQRLMKMASARLFGLSNWLTFTTPCVQSILSIMCFIFVANRNQKHKIIYVLMGLILFFSAIINARTSLVVMMVGFFVFIILSKYTAKSKIAIIMLSGIILFVIIRFGLPLLELYSPKTYNWLELGTNQILSLIRGVELENSYFNYFSIEGKVALPEGISILFGKGFRLIANTRGYVTSDIGYINDLWLGGIMYVVLKYSMYFCYMRKLSKSDDGIIRYYGLFLVILFFVLNIKGSVFTMNGIANLLVISYVCVGIKTYKNRDHFLMGNSEYN